MTSTTAPTTARPRVSALRACAAIAFAALALGGCIDDDDDFFDDEPDLPPIENVAVLNLDGDNVSGPTLGAGTHRLGVQFYEEDLLDFDGRELEGARIFVGRQPASLRISVHPGGEAVPGFETEALEVVGDIPSGGWFDFAFERPVTIDASDVLWLVVEVEHDAPQQSIGCDAPGSRIDGGDWLWSNDRWRTFQERSGEEVNWNIRGLVAR